MTSRIARLEEQRRAPARCYIIRVSDPPTAEELAELAQAEADCRAALDAGSAPGP
jgi:hypothetical protein